MSGSAALARRTQTGLAQQSAQSFAAEREAFDLAQFFAEMMIVETGIGGTSQAQYRAANLGGQATGAGASAVGVCQSRLPVFAQASLKTTNLTDAEREQVGGSGTRHGSFNASRNHTHSLQFLLTQRERPSSHEVTFSRCC
jgi:hypothetical protein